MPISHDVIVSVLASLLTAVIVWISRKLNKTLSNLNSTMQQVRDMLPEHRVMFAQFTIEHPDKVARLFNGEWKKQ